MSIREFVDVIPNLWSLGADYMYEGEVSSSNIDPEITILKTLKHYWGADDVFFMLFNLLILRIGPLIHVERLAKLAQAGFLNEDETLLLIALSKKLVERGDHRFKIIYKKLYRKGMKFSKIPDLLGLESAVKFYGAEENLLEFNTKVRKFPSPDDKKLHPLKTIFKRNGWIKLRALIGPNYRADILYLKSTGQAKNVSEAAKLVGCDYSAAYRLLKFTSEFENLKTLLEVD